VRKDTVLLPHDLAFQLIKRKKNYKAKFSTNLILKKRPTKIILEGEKPIFCEENYNTFPNKVK
jgi:hypothetical protein